MKRQYSIWDEMRRMQEQMDSLFGNFFIEDPFFGREQYLLEEPYDKNRELITSKYKQPISDVYETDNEVVAEIEMPGMDKKDIKVHVSNDSIEIKAETNIENKQEDKKKGMYRLERNYSGFFRKIGLPKNIDSSMANAEYKNGILKITVPKLKIEESKKKLLDIK